MMYAESENGQTKLLCLLTQENQGSLKQFKENSNNQREAEMLSAGYFYSQKALELIPMEGRNGGKKWN